jgi:hypothetical protein
MISGADFKWGTFIGPVSVATNATASASIDLNTLGNPGVLLIKARLPAASATNASAKWTVLAFGASDTNTFSTNNTVAGLVGTTNTTAAAGQFVLAANNNTAAGQDTVITVKNPGRYGRYWFVQYQAPASNFTVNIDAVGVDSVEAPSTAAEASLNGTVVAI